MSDQMHIDSLWKRFLKGDDRAYTELYNLYIDDLFAYGVHFTTNRESVKDCIQEVFISLYKDRSKQRKVNNIKSYLFVSLKNELFDLFKKSVEYYQIETIEPVFQTEYSVEDQYLKNEAASNNVARVKNFCRSCRPSKTKWSIIAM